MLVDRDAVDGVDRVVGATDAEGKGRVVVRRRVAHVDRRGARQVVLFRRHRAADADGPPSEPLRDLEIARGAVVADGGLGQRVEEIGRRAGHGVVDERPLHRHRIGNRNQHEDRRRLHRHPGSAGLPVAVVVIATAKRRPRSARIRPARSRAARRAAQWPRRTAPAPVRVRGERLSRPRVFLVAATAAAADAVPARRAFLARVGVLAQLRLQRVRIELHRRLGEFALFPRLRRVERRAAGTPEQRRSSTATRVRMRRVSWFSYWRRPAP